MIGLHKFLLTCINLPYPKFMHAEALDNEEDIIKTIGKLKVSGANMYTLSHYGVM